jgi:phosphomannomutase
VSHRFNPVILREYDIRGTVGETLFEDDAYAIGRAFGSVVAEAGGKTICVGFDGRTTSPALETRLTQGLSECGLDVLRVGLGPTPLLYFSVHHLAADAGVMVTGSHNPKDHNGFKLMLGTHSFFGADITALGARAEAGDFAGGGGSVADVETTEAYLAELTAAYSGHQDNPPSVAWDPGNGAAGDVVTALVERLPGRHVLINAVIDGSFPAHHPDPTVPENLVQLQQTIADNGCDLGIALDGDGDRIGVIDGQGRILWSDQLLALLARDVLAANPGAPVIADVKSSAALFDEIARLGGRPIMWNTGHSLIKKKMADEKAPLAGEMSGHIFFADHYYGFDDAVYAGVRLLAHLARTGSTLAALYDELPALVNTPEMRFDCPDDRKFEVIKELRSRLAAAGADVNDIDGVRVTTPDGWWLVRASNTQAVLVARAEAEDEAGLDALRKKLAAALAECGVALPDF